MGSKATYRKGATEVIETAFFQPNPRTSFSLLALVFYLSGCTSSQPHTPIAQPLASESIKAQKGQPTNNDEDIEALLRAEYQRWENTPHKFGGNDVNGVDCSGLVHQVYKELFQIKIPRSTATLINIGTPTKRIDLKAGDLVFFKLPPPSYSRHVGIYLSNDEFMHASNKGVMTSRLDQGYWSKYYQTARRPYNL